MFEVSHDLQVELTNADRAFALKAMIQRNTVKRDNGIPDRIVASPECSLFYDYRGLCGEIAVGKMLNLEPRQIFGFGGDGGYDFLWHDTKIDVKWTSYINGHLIINRNGSPDDVKADLYVLTSGNDMWVTIHGYATKQDIKQFGFIKNLGYGDNLVLTKDKLTDFRSLIEN